MGKSFRNNNQEPEITNPVRKELGRYIVHTIYIYQLSKTKSISDQTDCEVKKASLLLL